MGAMLRVRGLDGLGHVWRQRRECGRRWRVVVRQRAECEWRGGHYSVWRGDRGVVAKGSVRGNRGRAIDFGGRLLGGQERRAVRFYPPPGIMRLMPVVFELSEVRD